MLVDPRRASGAVTVSLSCSRGRRFAVAGLAGLLSHRTPIAAAPARARRRRCLPALVGGTTGPSPTPRRRRLRLGPAPRWDMHLPQAGLCEMALGGSCERGRLSCMKYYPGRPEEVCAVAARRRRAAVSRRAADTRRGSAPMNAIKRWTGTWTARRDDTVGPDAARDADKRRVERASLGVRRQRGRRVVVEARRGRPTRADDGRSSSSASRSSFWSRGRGSRRLLRGHRPRPAAREDRRRFSSR